MRIIQTISMKNGEYLGFVEEITKHAQDPKNFKTLEEYRNYEIGWLTLRLISLINISAARGKKSASIELNGLIRASEHQYASRLIIGSVSQTMQEAGFQTDEVYEEVDEDFIHQLTVFWSDGKDIREAKNQLGRINPARIEKFELPFVNTDHAVFRLYIVDPES